MNEPHDSPDAGATYVLTLFVAGANLHSEMAIANLQRLCDAELPGRYELEIVDVLKDPQRAEDARVLATPTLVKQLPPPLRRVVGDLSDTEKLVVGLHLRGTRFLPSIKEPTE